ncbi:hypothetical protein RhiJN_17959 [Ceratobasidium sp. AG-Ba]|nr:hypothetical protein RhiJN_17959 [Ceratobasidium sp. AG-Ba]
MSAIRPNRGFSAPPRRSIPLMPDGPRINTREYTEPLAANQPGASLGAYETRQRTQLIVDGFSNLALLSILFSGVQAQFISSTMDENSNATARATNAVFFSGLMLSVCSALLATLSGRWFSILREDDSEFLSSYWLAAEVRQQPVGIQEYIKFQKEAWMRKLPQHLQSPKSPIMKEQQRKDSGTFMYTAPPESMLDAVEAGMGPGFSPESLSSNPRERDVQFIIQLLNEEIKGETTFREKLMPRILLSAVGVCVAAFALFCVGILMLVWNTQPFSVAVTTTVLTGLCVMLMPGFFLQHRHKRVISRLKLGRAAL